jgi:hypothetical protein
MPKIVIEVTAEDIAAGVKQDSERCPIARAARRALGRAKVAAVEVDGEYLYERRTELGGRRLYLLPREARELIRAFDAAEAVLPFAFEPKELS